MHFGLIYSKKNARPSRPQMQIYAANGQNSLVYAC